MSEKKLLYGFHRSEDRAENQRIEKALASVCSTIVILREYLVFTASEAQADQVANKLQLPLVEFNHSKEPIYE